MKSQFEKQFDCNNDKCAKYNPAITFQDYILLKSTEHKNIYTRILL